MLSEDDIETLREKGLGFNPDHVKSIRIGTTEYISGHILKKKCSLIEYTDSFKNDRVFIYGSDAELIGLILTHETPEVHNEISWADEGGEDDLVEEELRAKAGEKTGGSHEDPFRLERELPGLLEEAKLERYVESLSE